jgi:hypothetical protein
MDVATELDVPRLATGVFTGSAPPC